MSESESQSRIKQFYTGKNILITGASGFVGICLVEKLLRCIPDVGCIYVLLRPKKGVDVSQRLTEMRKNSVFEVLNKSGNTEVFKKLVAVAGDIGEDNLGLSPQDRAMLCSCVHVVVHSAATLDFQENLRPTITVNLLGTRRVLALCRDITTLKSMVHVSSAYANSFLLRTEEKVYPAPADVDYVISLLDKMDDDALLEMQPKLLGDHPNTYTFTKHLAEVEVEKASEHFPCTIVRPTVILGAWKEPVPGWTIAKTGPPGFFMGSSRGVVRRLPLSTTNVQDYIPVDVVVNQLLVAGHAAAADKSGLTVYHCSSSTCHPFRWYTMDFKVNRYLQMYPIKSAIWYPYLKFLPSLWLFRLSAIFVHFIPALILDTFLRLTGGKPILFRLHKNVWNSLTRLQKFIFTEWFFENPNTMRLSETMSEADKQLFFIDITLMDWHDFFINLLLGVRKYLNKEDESTLEVARSKNTVLLILHIILQLSVMIGLWWLFAVAVGMTLAQTAWVAPIIYILYNFL